MKLDGYLMPWDFALVQRTLAWVLLVSALGLGGAAADEDADYRRSQIESLRNEAAVLEADAKVLLEAAAKWAELVKTAEEFGDSSKGEEKQFWEKRLKWRKTMAADNKEWADRNIENAESLREQADEIEQRNQQLQIALRDAENTFDTVALSSEVATLLREGSRNFAALLRLDLPPLRGFENEELKAEFERLTEKMVNLQ